jgi:hypothetical protein
MSLVLFLLVTALQLFMGFGLLGLFRLWLRPILFLPLAILCGIGISSFVPFLLQLFYIPLTAFNIFAALILVTLLLNLRWKYGLAHLSTVLPHKRPSLSFYDLPYILLAVFIVVVSVWRCYYYPPFPRDLTSGAEVIASYAVKEKTMINSVFSVDLESTNNPFKPPFIASLQIIYKYIGFTFGQVWLSMVFACFIVFLYGALCIKLHRLIAGLLVIFFLAIPEMYAYTFMALFDYSNAVYFFLGVYFFVSYCSRRQKNELAFSGLMMALATYTRSETLVLACLMMLPLLWHHYRKKDSLLTMAGRTIIFLAPSFLCYFLTVTIYLGWYLPVSYQVGGLVNKNLLNLGPLFSRFYDMNMELIFSESGVNYYGYFIFIFIIVLLFDLVLSDFRTRSSRNWLAAILVVYLGLAFLGYLLPLLDLDHSTKRGLFKMFPLMLLYMGTSRLLTQLSTSIKKWEQS